MRVGDRVITQHQHVAIVVKVPKRSNFVTIVLTVMSPNRRKIRVRTRVSANELVIKKTQIKKGNEV